MEVNEVKDNLGKEVFYRLSKNEKYNKYILNAYIFRILAKDSNKRLHQVELQDTSSTHSIVIANLDDVKLSIDY